MKAIRSHQPAGISGLVYEEVPDPTLTIGDVLVKVAACGITHNELDWPLRIDRNGHQRDVITPGQEMSGVVTALGVGTAGVAVGDEVFGLTDPYRDAAAAEYVAVEARNVAPKPQTVDHVHAAAVPRQASQRGRPCSTTASWPRARRWSSTARAARSGRRRSSWPAGPAPR